MLTDEIRTDISAQWDEIERWYADNAPRSHAALGAPATEQDLASLERVTGVVLPHDVRASLLRHNGSGKIHGLDYLDAGWAAQVWMRLNARLARGDFKGLEPADATGERFAAVWWSSKWLPVAEHRAGTLVCVDTAPGPEGTSGQILQLELDDEGPALTAWCSFAQWLDSYRLDLKAGKYRTDANGELDRIAE
jgi:cell wall assembly regulator SMI1